MLIIVKPITTNNEDIKLLSKILQFKENERNKTIPVKIIDDILPELVETFIIKIKVFSLFFKSRKWKY